MDHLSISVPIPHHFNCQKFKSPFLKKLHIIPSPINFSLALVLHDIASETSNIPPSIQFKLSHFAACNAFKNRFSDIPSYPPFPQNPNSAGLDIVPLQTVLSVDVPLVRLIFKKVWSKLRKYYREPIEILDDEHAAKPIPPFVS